MFMIYYSYLKYYFWAPGKKVLAYCVILFTNSLIKRHIYTLTQGPKNKSAFMLFILRKKCFMQWQTLLYHLCKDKHWSIFVQNISHKQFLYESKSGHKVINSIFALCHNSKGFPQMYVSITIKSIMNTWSV